MLKSKTFKLNGVIYKKDVTTFANLLLKSTSVLKGYLDPVERNKLTIKYSASVEENQVEKEINQFIHNWFNNVQSKKEETVKSKYVNKTIRTKHCCPTNTNNVSNKLLEEEWIVLLKKSSMGYSDNLFKLLDIFDKSYTIFFKSKLGNVIGRQYSSLLPMYYLEKMNYLKNSPKQLFFASHLTFDKVDKFNEEITQSVGEMTENADSYLTSKDYVLQSASCFNIYFELEDKKFNTNQVYTVLGDCYRNEQKLTHFLERLLNFKMREFVFIGEPGFVNSYKEKTLEWTIEWMDEIGIQGHTALANDPFFLTGDESKKFTIPENIKFEVRADIPYKKDTIAIASFDIHGNFFSKIFNFGFENGKESWSGCIGLGLERAVWSFLQQYGLDKSNWPDKVKELVEAYV